MTKLTLNIDEIDSIYHAVQDNVEMLPVDRQPILDKLDVSELNLHNYNLDFDKTELDLMHKAIGDVVCDIACGSPDAFPLENIQSKIQIARFINRKTHI